MIKYIGGFPPPYGGVTVKNELLYSEIEERLGIKGVYIEKIDTQLNKRKPVKIVKEALSLLFLTGDWRLIIAPAGNTRRKLSLFLYFFNKKLLRRSILIVMGGSFADSIKDDHLYIRTLNEYKKIYVETKGMKEKLNKLHLTNISIYPNCRIHPSFECMPSSPVKKLRCVFFSLVSLDKGADVVLEAAQSLPEVSFDFYGHTAPEYDKIFCDRVEQLANVTYYGVYQVSGDNVYEKLNGYDLLLLPTRSKTEGIPGVLVEAKIAALPAIVSDIAYNAEIVKDSEEGIVLPQNDAQTLIRAISSLDRDRGRLLRLKEGAKASAQRYYVDGYLSDILKELSE